MALLIRVIKRHYSLTGVGNERSGDISKMERDERWVEAMGLTDSVLPPSMRALSGAVLVAERSWWPFAKEEWMGRQ